MRGPAAAIVSSSPGDWLDASASVAPPKRYSVIPPTSIPRRRATRAWASSCSSTEPKKIAVPTDARRIAQPAPRSGWTTRIRPQNATRIRPATAGQDQWILMSMPATEANRSVRDRELTASSSSIGAGLRRDQGQLRFCRHRRLALPPRRPAPAAVRLSGRRPGPHGSGRADQGQSPVELPRAQRKVRSIDLRTKPSPPSAGVAKMWRRWPLSASSPTPITS